MGCTNVAQLLRGIAALGFPGSRFILAQALEAWRSGRLSRQAAKKERRIAWRLSMRLLCLRPPEQLKPEERAVLDRLLAKDADLARRHGLFRSFCQILAERHRANA